MLNENHRDNRETERQREREREREGGTDLLSDRTSTRRAETNVNGALCFVGNCSSYPVRACVCVCVCDACVCVCAVIID